MGSEPTGDQQSNGCPTIVRDGKAWNNKHHRGPAQSVRDNVAGINAVTLTADQFQHENFPQQIDSE